MPEDLHHHPSRNVLSQQQAGRRVPEIMEPDWWQACASQQFSELTEVVSWIDRRADRSRENTPAVPPE